MQEGDIFVTKAHEKYLSSYINFYVCHAKKQKSILAGEVDFIQEYRICEIILLIAAAE